MTDTDDIGARIRAAAESVSAPLALQEHVRRHEEPARRGRREPPRRLLALIGGILATLATITALLAPGPPTVAAVAAVALDAPTDAAPEELEDYLPGYDAVGARTDRVEGRIARTVIYQRGDVGIHYTVVEGKPLDLPGSERTTIGDTEFALERDGAVSLVAWHREGETCILASRGASPEEMVAILRRA